jgi:hypothetical protein
LKAIDPCKKIIYFHLNQIFVLLLKGLPISEIQFPSVVICSQGFDINAIIAALYDDITNGANTTTTEQFGLTPIQSAKLAVRAMRGEVRFHAVI